jgi:hypothetical protein
LADDEGRKQLQKRKLVAGGDYVMKRLTFILAAAAQKNCA